MPRTADHQIEPIFIERWSPRAFSDAAMSQDELMRLFEAARWSPSSYNSQPWRFVYGLRGTPAFERLLGLLSSGNAGWAKQAAVLMVLASKTTMAPRGEEMPSHSHSLDAGSAWQSLSLQATAMGWHTHGMVGFDMPRAASELAIPDGYQVEMAIAVGKQGDKARLPEHFQAMEQPNGRNPVESFAFEGAFPPA